MNRLMRKVVALNLCGGVIGGEAWWLTDLRSKQPSIMRSFGSKKFNLEHFSDSMQPQVFWINNFMTEHQDSKMKFLLRLLQIPTVNNLEVLSEYIDEYFMEQWQIEDRRLWVVQALDPCLFISTAKCLLDNGFLNDQRTTISELMSSLLAIDSYPIDRNFSDQRLRIGEKQVLSWPLYFECSIGILEPLQLSLNDLADIADKLYRGIGRKPESLVYSIIEYVKLVRAGSDIEVLLDAHRLAGPEFALKLLNSPFMANAKCRRRLISSKIRLDVSPFKEQAMTLDENFCQAIKRIGPSSKVLYKVLIVVKEARSLILGSRNQMGDTLRALAAPWKQAILNHLPYEDCIESETSFLFAEFGFNIARIARFTIDDMVDFLVLNLCVSCLDDHPSDGNWMREGVSQEIGCADYEDDHKFKIRYIEWLMTTMPEDQKWTTLKRYLSLPEHLTKSKTAEKFFERFISCPITMYILRTLFSTSGFDLEWDASWMLKFIMVSFWRLREGPVSDWSVIMAEIDRRLFEKKLDNFVIKLVLKLGREMFPDFSTAKLDFVDMQFNTLKELIHRVLDVFLEGTNKTIFDVEKWIKECNNQVDKNDDTFMTDGVDGCIW